MPAKKKAKRTTQPTLEQQLAEARGEVERLQSQIGSLRRVLQNQDDHTQQARLERDGLLLLIALATNSGGIAQVKTPGAQTPNAEANK